MKLRKSTQRNTTLSKKNEKLNQKKQSSQKREEPQPSPPIRSKLRKRSSNEHDKEARYMGETPDSPKNPSKKVRFVDFTNGKKNRSSTNSTQNPTETPKKELTEAKEPSNVDEPSNDNKDEKDKAKSAKPNKRKKDEDLEESSDSNSESEEEGSESDSSAFDEDEGNDSDTESSESNDEEDRRMAKNKLGPLEQVEKEALKRGKYLLRRKGRDAEQYEKKEEKPPEEELPQEVVKPKMVPRPLEIDPEGIYCGVLSKEMEDKVTQLVLKWKLARYFTARYAKRVQGNSTSKWDKVGRGEFPLTLQWSSKVTMYIDCECYNSGEVGLVIVVHDQLNLLVSFLFIHSDQKEKIKLRENSGYLTVSWKGNNLVFELKTQDQPLKFILLFSSTKDIESCFGLLTSFARCRQKKKKKNSKK